MTLVDERPSPGKPRAYRFPPFTTARLDNGMTIIGCHTPGRPLGSAVLLLEAGAFIEPPDGAGVASLASRALTEGTETLDGAAFAEACERIGADIAADVGWETTQVSARAPVGRLEAALELLADAATRPTFPPSEVARAQQEALDDLRQLDANPMSRAERGFIAAIYTPESPYARPRLGKKETIAALDRDAVESFYRRFATPGSATLIVAGDFDGFDPHRVAERLFGSWTVDEPTRVQLPVREAVGETSVTVIDRPGSVQSNFIIGHAGIRRSAPEYLATDLMVYVLGGFFGSRINMRLREEKGYTYGSRAVIDARREPGPFRAAAPVETSVTADAIVETLGVIRSVHAGGITQQELDEARDHEAGVFALRFETPDAIAGGIAEIVVYGLPEDYFDTLGAAIEAVTLDDAAAAARAHLRPDASAIVVVGDAEQIADPLRAAGLGAVTVVVEPPPGR